MKKCFVTVVLIAALATTSHAVTLRTVIRDCGSDGKQYCPKSSYGKAMQDCLATHMEKLTPACKVVMKKLKNGERVTLF